MPLGLPFVASVWIHMRFLWEYSTRLDSQNDLADVSPMRASVFSNTAIIRSGSTSGSFGCQRNHHVGSLLSLSCWSPRLGIPPVVLAAGSLRPVRRHQRSPTSPWYSARLAWPSARKIVANQGHGSTVIDFASSEDRFFDFIALSLDNGFNLACGHCCPPVHMLSPVRQTSCPPVHDARHHRLSKSASTLAAQRVIIPWVGNRLSLGITWDRLALKLYHI
ncbi:hypothetical protein CALVIDRAFT_533114 [Calocera viscosa TUFC12733]|uniref:Uncharacterized protein n=1 Tax=Calocera viscosa (strain TUFC12733) TaxID=1330018 RepID=A0A167RCY7_CALVF|nr:hypothetical protein CALVIDRAFT_533114 [Calocera viscosa TUFC12733]